MLEGACSLGSTGRFVAVKHVQGLEAHGLEVLLFHLEGLLLADFVGGDLELREDGPVVGEVDVLDAVHHLQPHLGGVALPHDAIAPGGHPVLLARVVPLRLLIVLVRRGEVDFSLRIVTVELILQI